MEILRIIPCKLIISYVGMGFPNHTPKVSIPLLVPPCIRIKFLHRMLRRIVNYSLTSSHIFHYSIEWRWNSCLKYSLLIIWILRFIQISILPILIAKQIQVIVILFIPLRVFFPQISVDIKLSKLYLSYDIKTLHIIWIVFMITVAIIRLISLTWNINILPSLFTTIFYGKSL